MPTRIRGVVDTYDTKKAPNRKPSGRNRSLRIRDDYEERPQPTMFIYAIARHALERLPRTTEGVVLVVVFDQFDKGPPGLLLCEGEVADELGTGAFGLDVWGCA